MEAERKAKEDSWREGESNVKMVVDEDVIAEVISATTGIPVFKLTQAESKKLLNMEAELHKRIIGQDEAVSALSRSIRRTRVGLKDPKRPSGSFIFAGPTGVGKTELAKTLAEFLFDDEDTLIRVDMSEFWRSMRHRVSLVRLRDTSVMRRAASSPRRCAASRSPWCCSTRSRRRIRISSTRCCRCWMTAI